MEQHFSSQTFEPWGSWEENLALKRSDKSPKVQSVFVIMFVGFRPRVVYRACVIPENLHWEREASHEAKDDV